MAKLPLYVSAFIIIGGAMLLAVGGLLFARRVLRIPRDDSDHDVASVFYASVGATYGVLLAFMVVVVWQRFSDTDQAVTAEAADLVVVFRDTQTFPDPLRQQAQDALRAYANEVMTVEWRTHIGAGAHRTPDPLNPVWAIYRQLQPANSYQEAQYSGAADRLHELEHQRHLRHLSGETTLPPLVWPVLIVGAVITISFSYFFRPRDLRSQAVMTATLAGLIGTVLFLIMSLNQPFTGHEHISREPFRHALQQFNALNAGDSGP